MKTPSAWATSRSLAMECLVSWHNSGKPVQGFLHSVVHSSELSDQDRQLAVLLVNGVLRRQQYLDAVISRFSRTKIAKMKPLTLFALRVGVFQLCFLNRIPDSAAVNETVKVLKKLRQPGWLCGFVNATLRTIARNMNELPDPEYAGDGNGPLLEHPTWLTDRWQQRYGQAVMREICAINSREAHISLLVNRKQTDRGSLAELFAANGIACRPGRFAPNSLILTGHQGLITNLPGYSQGLFQVQDQAAQLACHLLEPLRSNGRYLDCCAGLGGKTVAIALGLPPGAVLEAVEPDSRRFRLLKENLVRMRCQDQVKIRQQDLQGYAATGSVLFDGILVDAPCSGTGVIRRHPDIRWNRQPDDFLAFQKRQLSLLQTAASLLAPGGVLVYATCSLEPEENQQVIGRFVSETPQFNLCDCLTFLPDTCVTLRDGQGFFAPLPAAEHDGFFAARLERIC